MLKREITFELMTVKEVAEELGLPLKLAYELVQAGTFRVYRPSFKRIGVYKDDVLAYKSERCFGVEAQSEKVA